MRPPTSLSAALTLLLATDYIEAIATPVFPRAKSGDGYLAIPVGTIPRPHKVGKRSAIDATLQNMDFFYAIQVGMGTPPQNVTVLVDTGSSELWVNPDCSTAPSQQQADMCENLGQYNPRKSRTPPVGPFGREEINYGDPTDQSTQTSVDITYYADTLSFGSIQVKNQTFGVVTASDGQAQGIMGLAPDVRGGFPGDEPYSLLLNTMAEQGVIASRVFALDLRHSDSETGAIIYGGLDRSKFVGSLEARPIVRGIKGETRLAVNLTTLGLTLGRSQSFRLSAADTNVMLDSGTTLSRMHEAAAIPILEALGAQDAGEGYFYVPCSTRNAGGSVDFGFGNKVVRVPFSDFILTGEDSSDSDYCFVGIVITTDQQILGDTVLRAGYFVFDWDNREVHIAQAADCGSSDIVVAGRGSDAVPSVQGNCNENEAFPTGSGSPTITASNSGATNLIPTSAFTTTFTVTSCPVFDINCRTGVVTTRTVRPAEATAEPTSTSSPSGSGSGDGDGGGDEDAGVRLVPFTWVLVALGTLAMFVNIV